MREKLYPSLWETSIVVVVVVIILLQMMQAAMGRRLRLSYQVLCQRLLPSGFKDGVWQNAGRLDWCWDQPEERGQIAAVGGGGGEEEERECLEIVISDTSSTSETISVGDCLRHLWTIERESYETQGGHRNTGPSPGVGTWENRCWSDSSLGNKRSSNFVSSIAVVVNIPEPLEFLYH